MGEEAPIDPSNTEHLTLPESGITEHILVGELLRRPATASASLAASHK